MCNAYVLKENIYNDIHKNIQYLTENCMHIWTDVIFVELDEASLSLTITENNFLCRSLHINLNEYLIDKIQINLNE